jgi:hypothetical protein
VQRALCYAVFVEIKLLAGDSATLKRWTSGSVQNNATKVDLGLMYVVLLIEVVESVACSGRSSHPLPDQKRHIRFRKSLANLNGVYLNSKN